MLLTIENEYIIILWTRQNYFNILFALEFSAVLQAYSSSVMYNPYTPSTRALPPCRKVDCYEYNQGFRVSHSAPTVLSFVQKSFDAFFSEAQEHQNAIYKAKIPNKNIVITYLLILIASVTALSINAIFFHYVGNHYFPTQTILAGIILLLVLVGGYLQFHSSNPILLILREIFFFYLILSSIALITDAAQYTPFKPIDKVIIHFESSYKIHLTELVAWTAEHPVIKNILLLAYASLVYQLALLPLFIILTRNIKKIRTFYFFLLISALMGFSFYYFFPTTAPASNLESPFFLNEQYATGIKFHEIHSYLRPSTQAGGLIAFPSFHVIWAWFCLYLAYGYRILFIVLLPINCLLIASCVLLGWHYPLDLLGAALVIVTSHWLHRQFENY